MRALLDKPNGPTPLLAHQPAPPSAQPFLLYVLSLVAPLIYEEPAAPASPYPYAILALARGGKTKRNEFRRPATFRGHG